MLQRDVLQIQISRDIIAKLDEVVHARRKLLLPKEPTITLDEWLNHTQEGQQFIIKNYNSLSGKEFVRQSANAWRAHHGLPADSEPSGGRRRSPEGSKVSTIRTSIIEEALEDFFKKIAE